MDQTERDHIQHELEITANELLPGWIRRVELLQHDDDGMERDLGTLPAFEPRHGPLADGRVIGELLL